MRIANAMFGRRRGGLEQVFLDYCQALTLAGHEVHALVHPDAAVRGVLEERGTLFHALSNRNAWDPLAMLRLRRWLATWRPEVTIAHGNRAVGLLKGAGADPLVGVAQNHHLKCAGLAAVFCPTEALRRDYRARGIGEARITVVPNAVCAPPALPQRTWHDPPVIGAMGRFVPKKGFEVLIEGLRQLAAAGLPFRAIIAGDGAEAPALRQQARRAGLGQRLDFPGWADDKVRFFDRIDIFCLPSHDEPFGVVLLEAMAQGLPVIATDSEGPSEILTRGSDGVIVPRGEPAALAEAIAGMLRSRQRALAMGRRAHETVRRKYDLPLLAARLDRALAGVPGAGSPRSATIRVAP